jgi:hypothetical protein
MSNFSCIYHYKYNVAITDRRGRDRMPLLVRILLRRCVLNATLCDKVCHLLATGWWFSPSTPVSSTNTTDRHDIAEILLKVALNTIHPNLPLTPYISMT